MSEEKKVEYPELVSNVTDNGDVSVTAILADGTEHQFVLDVPSHAEYAVRAFKDHVRRLCAGVTSSEHVESVKEALLRGPEARRGRGTTSKTPTVLEASIMEFAGKTHAEALTFLKNFDPAGKRKLINDSRIQAIYKRIQAERAKEPTSPVQLEELDALLG